MSLLHPNYHRLGYKPFIKKDPIQMSKQSQSFVLNGTRMGETAKAVKFAISDCQGVDYKGLTTWFPFSQVYKSFTSPDEVGKDYIVVSEWILKEKALMPDLVDQKNKMAGEQS